MMKFLVNNPVGLGLIAICTLFAGLSAALMYSWNQPVSSGAAAGAAPEGPETDSSHYASQLGPIGDYRDVTERPVFEESRRPVLVFEGEVEGGEEVASVANAPEVKLTGVVITKDMKMATLKPLSNGESVIVHEGMPLQGEYYGWSVSSVQPRQVMLASLDGGTVELDLEVNHRRIAEPPKPPPELSAAAEGQSPAADGESEQPLTRAEEIRQRIAERREELRRQAESEQEDDDKEAKSGNRYQNAIQSMINRTRKDQDKETENDGG